MPEARLKWGEICLLFSKWAHPAMVSVVLEARVVALLWLLKAILMKRCIKGFGIHFVVVDSGEILSFVFWPGMNLLPAIAWARILGIDTPPVWLVKMWCFVIRVVKQGFMLGWIRKGGSVQVTGRMVAHSGEVLGNIAWSQKPLTRCQVVASFYFQWAGPVFFMIVGACRSWIIGSLPMAMSFKYSTDWIEGLTDSNQYKKYEKMFLHRTCFEWYPLESSWIEWISLANL